MKAHRLADLVIVYNSIRILKFLNFFRCQDYSKVKTCLVENIHWYNRIRALLGKASVNIFPLKTKFMLDVRIYMTPAGLLNIERLNTGTWFQTFYLLWFISETSFRSLNCILFDYLRSFYYSNNRCYCASTLCW